MYTTAAITVPSSVARGMVLSGSRTWAAGMVAASTPMKANSVAATQKLIACHGGPAFGPGISNRGSKCT